MTTARHLQYRSLLLALALGAGALTAQAQYKVVGPDGSVTYTDRAPSPSAGGKVSTVRRDGTVVAAPSAAAQAPLPLELRQAAARFPVTLYTSADCAPCDNARRLLRTRGIPFTERTVSDDADGEALARLSNGRTVPTLTVGAQVLRGYAETEWQSTFDLAGYPRESRLPRDYVSPSPTPLVAKAPDTPPTVVVSPEPRPVAEPPPPAEPAIRF